MLIVSPVIYDQPLFFQFIELCQDLLVQALDGRCISYQIGLRLLHFFEPELCPCHLALANFFQLRSQKIRNFKVLRNIFVNQHRLVDRLSGIVILQGPKLRRPCCLILALLQFLEGLELFFREVLLQ